MQTCSEFIQRYVLKNPQTGEESQVGRFLRILGLFSNEFYAYLKREVIPESGFQEEKLLDAVRKNIPYCPTSDFFARIGGTHKSLGSLGAGRKRFSKATFPGQTLYCTGISRGYARVVKELLHTENPPKMTCVAILDFISKKEGCSVTDAELNTFVTYRDTYARRNMARLIEANLVSRKGNRHELVPVIRDVFSPETERTFIELTQWEPYYIDVIP